jgi:hypothetical protein
MWGQVTRTDDYTNALPLFELLQGKQLTSITELMPCTSSHHAPPIFLINDAT